MGLAITLEIIQRIFELDPMVFQKGVHLHGSLKPQQVAQLGASNTPLEIGFQRKSLERCAGEVAPGTCQGIHEFLGKRDGYASHEHRIPEGEKRSTEELEGCWRHDSFMVGSHRIGETTLAIYRCKYWNKYPA